MKMPKLDRKTVRVILAIALGVVAVFLMGRLSVGPQAIEEDGHDHASDVAKAEVWTCSMHPQIKLPKAGKCPICFMDLIPVDSGGGDDVGIRELSVSENAARLMEIETVPVERRSVTSEIRMVGKVAYDETRVSHISAWVPGRLDRLFVDTTGVAVRRGEPLVSLYSPELLSAQEELLQALQATRQLGASDMSIARQSTEATVAAVREKLRLWGLTPGQIAQIEERGTADDRVTIHAPSGGIVVHKDVQEGMYVETGSRIYTIADLSRVWVNLDAYESDLAWLQNGQEVEFTTEAYAGEVFRGTISFIQPVLDEKTRTVAVRVALPNADGRLKPGMFVRGVVQAELTTADELPLVIPATAPLLTGKRAVVYVAIPDKDRPTYEGREVVLGPRVGEHYIVTDGLREGDRVVTRGAFKIDAELQIRAKPSMMSPGSEVGERKPEDRGQRSEVGERKSLLRPAGYGGQAEGGSRKAEGGRAQTHCPVMGGAINKDVFVDYNGMRIYFCCAGCDGPFLEKAEEYLQKMRAEGVEPEKLK